MELNWIELKLVLLVMRLSYKGAVQLFISYQIINVFSVISWKHEKSKFHLYINAVTSAWTNWTYFNIIIIFLFVVFTLLAYIP